MFWHWEASRARSAFQAWQGTAISWTRFSILDMQGNLIAMLKKAKPAEEAGIDDAESSLKLVAGAGNRRILPALSAVI
ncbi:hypothetical protein [Leisingera aquimarina]|uniref:hypothetical protein n=1 Tax=Leisingera aquimarina TaxID=476529 RepID=UPI0012EB8B6B|nr:hypothetical protein [Leisingera aquimarina]